MLEIRDPNLVRGRAADRDAGKIRIVGIDPGVTGALAFFVGDDAFSLELRALYDMPTFTKTVSNRRTKTGKAKRATIHLASLRDILANFNPSCCLVERASAMPRTIGRGEKRTEIGMGATSAFNYGAGFGMVLGVIVGVGSQYVLVEPRSWKAQASLVGAEKDASRAVAERLYPTADLARKKDHARADAILIAHYGIRIRNGESQRL